MGSDLRPWDDPSDPKPAMFDADGRWTSEGVEWIKRSGRRRHRWYFGSGSEASSSEGVGEP